MKKSTLTKALAIAGTVLVWLPILAPAVFMALRFLRAGFFRFDYLMPAELFPVVLAGGVLLLWAALRAKTRRGLIGAALGTGSLFLVASQVIAVVTGLASGENEATGWKMMLVIGLIGGYIAAEIVLGVAGILLKRDLGRGLNSGSGVQPAANPQ